MAFWDCKREDPFVRRVRDLYGANIVRAPRAGIRPLSVVAVLGERVEMRGSLAPLVSGSEPLVLPSIASVAAADMSGQRSSTVDLNLGLDLAAKFLAALGVPAPEAALDVTLWKGVKSISFEVRDVREEHVDINDLGRVLRGRKIDLDHPATAVFLASTGAVMHIITRTLTSPCMAVRATGEDEQALYIRLDALAGVLGGAAGKVASSQESNSVLSFRGAESVTFALSAVPCNIGQDGSFTFGLELRGAQYLDKRSGPPLVLPMHMPVVDRDGLLSFDE